MPLLAQSTAVLLLWLAGAAPSDAELALLRSSLRPSELKGVEADLGGLDTLPTFRVDARLLPGSARLEGVAQLSIRREEASAGFELCVRADRSGAAQIRGELVSLGAAKAAGTKLSIERVARGRYRVPPIATTAERVELEIPFAASLVALDFPRPASARSRGFLGRFAEHFLLTGFHPELCSGGPELAPAPWDSEPEWGALSNFFVSVEVPSGYRVTGSGVPLGEIPGPDGTVRFTRAGAAARGFALAALGEARQVRAKADGVELVATMRAEDEDAGRAALDVAGRALRKFGADLGAYPWAQLELVVFPAQSHCFAFPGLIACGRDGVRGSNALVAHGLSSGFPQNVRASIDYELGHAIAHQWLGGLIGSDNQGHPELDEPLATFLALLFTEKHLKGPHCVDAETFLKVPFALLRVQAGVDAPAARPLSAYGGQLELVALLHGKGGLFHRALRKTVGASAWSRAVRRYARENRFRQVSSDGVLDLLRAGSPARASVLDALQERHLRGLHGDADLAYELPE